MVSFSFRAIGPPDLPPPAERVSRVAINRKYGIRGRVRDLRIASGRDIHLPCQAVRIRRSDKTNTERKRRTMNEIMTIKGIDCY